MTLERSPSHSWWWDSHQSPKHSRWLESNLEELDEKVKAMLRLIEADADSFAQRAEMYYKRRPELVNLVEEFYRAYRSLSERYDHLRGEIKQNIPKALQLQYGLSCDSPQGSPFGRFYRKDLQGCERSLKGFERAQLGVRPLKGLQGEQIDNEVQQPEVTDVLDYSGDDIKGNEFSEELLLSSSDSEVENSTETEKLQQAVHKMELENKRLDYCCKTILDKNEVLQIKVKELQGENVSLQQDIHNLTKKCQASLEENSDLDSQVKHLGDTVHRLEHENTRLANEASGSILLLKKVEEGMTTLQHEKMVQREELLQAQEQKNQLQTEVERLQAECSNFKCLALDNADCVRALEKDTRELREQKQRLTADILVVSENHKVAVTGLRFMKGEVSSMVQTNKKLRAELLQSEDNENHVTVLENEIKQLREQNQTLAADISVASEHGKFAMTAMRFMKGEVSSLVQRNKKLRDELLGKTFSETLITEELSSLQDENRALRNALQNFHFEEAKKVDDLNSKIEGLHEELNLLGEENKRQNEILLERSEEKREAIRQLCFSIDMLTEKNRRLEEGLFSAKRQLHGFYNASSYNRLPTWKKVILGARNGPKSQTVALKF